MLIYSGCDLSISCDVLLNGSEEFFSRLTFTKHLSLIYFFGDFDSFKVEIKNLSISNFEGKSFCVPGFQPGTQGYLPLGVLVKLISSNLTILRRIQNKRSWSSLQQS